MLKLLILLHNNASVTSIFTVNNIINLKIPGITTNINSKENLVITSQNKVLYIYNEYN